MKICIENDKIVLKGLFKTKRMMLGEVIRVQVLGSLEPRLRREPFKVWDAPYVACVALSDEERLLTLDCYNAGFGRAIARLESDGWKIAEAMVRSNANSYDWDGVWEDAIREAPVQASCGRAAADARTEQSQHAPPAQGSEPV